MKLSIPCRHCGNDRLWQDGSGGGEGDRALVAAVSIPGVARASYVCLVSPDGECEPAPARTPAQRMIDDLAARSRSRWGGGGRMSGVKGKRR